MTAVFPTAIPDFTGEVGVPADEIAEWATHISEELVAVARGGSPVRTVTDDYTLVADDAGKVVEANKASAIAVTVPPNASVPFPIGTLVEVAQLGVGALTLVAGGGVTLNGVLTAAGRYGALLVRKRGANEWVVTQAPATGFATQADLDDEEDARIAGDALAIPLTQKAAANGVASLGADGILTMAQRPAAASPTLTGLRGAAVGTDIVSMGVTADTNDRFVQNADGKLEWGSGAAAVDTNLYRSAASVLMTDDELRVVLDLHARYGVAGQVTLGTAGPSSEAGIKFGSAGDTNLYRSAASTLKTDDTMAAALDVYSRHGAATQVAMGALGPSGVAGMVFGSAVDTNLYRYKASGLKTDDDFVAPKVGIGADTHTDNIVRAVDTWPSSVGRGSFAFLAGDASHRIATAGQGIISQIYPAAWSDPGQTYAAVNAHLNQPAGSNFVPWATISTVTTAAAKVTDNPGGLAGPEAVAYWGSAEGSAGCPLWGFVCEVRDHVGATIAAADMAGIEVALIPKHQSSVVTGVDIIAKGEVSSDRGIFIRADSADADAGWDTGIIVEVPAIPMEWREQAAAAGVGRWRWVNDAGQLRLDHNTHASGAFATSTCPLFVDANGNVQLAGPQFPGSGSMGGGVQVVCIANAATVPTSNPTVGPLIYGQAGALKARGTSGTITTMAPAEPHCPTCGRDFALEWESDTLGHLVLCMWCVSEGLTRGVIERTAA